MAAFLADAAAPADGGGLRRTVGTFQLTMIGIGATIGTGIFFALDAAVPEAGPAVTVSFVIAAVAAALTALCYAELASAVPVSGSAYSYAYATLGEFAACAVGWCLLLEYAVSGAAIAVSWGQYLNDLTRRLFGVQMPEALSAPPGAGGYLNVPGAVLVLLCGLLLVRGAKESALVNTVMVLLKLAVLALFVTLGLTGFDSAHLHPFAPMGMAGIGAAASTVFFSFIGLDAVSTAGEEVRDPRRTLPRAIILALLVVTTVYVLVALVGVGAQPWTAFAGQEAGLSAILARVTGAGWPGALLSAGAVLSIVSVTLVVLYGQTRILFSMGRDGMLPAVFHRVDRRTGTPVARHPHRQRIRGADGRGVPAGRPGGPDQPGHPARLHRRIGGRDRAAPHRAGPRPGLPRPRIPRGAGAVRGVLRLSAVRAAAGHLPAVRRLARRGPGRVPPLRPAPLAAPAAPVRAAR